MNVTALPLPAQEGIHFCEIDGKPFFRVIDLADKFFPQRSPHRANIQARAASRLLIDKKRPTMKNVTKGAERRGQYLPLVTMEEAADLFQDPAVRREVSNQSGALIGWIIKEKRIKAAMTEAKIEAPGAEVKTVTLAPPGFQITPVDMVWRSKKVNGTEIRTEAHVPAILVESPSVAPFVLLLKGGAVFIEALEIANIIMPSICESLQYEAIRDTKVTTISARLGRNRTRRFIGVEHLGKLAEGLYRLPEARFAIHQAEHLRNIKATIAQALDAWPAAHSKGSENVVVFPTTINEPTIAPVAVPVETSERVGEKLLKALDNLQRQNEAQGFIINGLRQEIAMVRLAQIEAQKLLAVIEDLQKNSLAQSAAINAQRGIIDKLTGVINTQTRTLTILAEREADRATLRHHEVIDAIEDNTPKAARPLLDRLFGVS